MRYNVGDQSASHGSYMQELGVRNQCHYPGFSEDPMVAFRDLAHDLGFADDFLSGSAAVLRKAAATEAADTSEQRKRAMARDVGDIPDRQRLREQFWGKHYAQVVALAQTLKYPDQMTDSERRMVEIARKKNRGRRESVMASIKGVLSGLAALFVAEFVFFWPTLKAEKATGLVLLKALLVESIFSPRFWIVGVLLFGLFFVASRRGTVLRVLFFWIPTLTITVLGLSIAALYAYLFAIVSKRQ